MNKSYKKTGYAKKKLGTRNRERTTIRKHKRKSRRTKSKRTKSKGGGNGPSTAVSAAEKRAPLLERHLSPSTPMLSHEVPTAASMAEEQTPRGAALAFADGGKESDLLQFTPEWSHQVPTESPYLSFFPKLNQKRKAWFSKRRGEAPESPRDKRVWQASVQRVMDRYNERFKEKSIPAGTLLFHGSLDDSFDIFDPSERDRPVFFGIEANISLWYIFEAAATALPRDVAYAGRYFTEKRPYGYLYIYKTTKEIPAANIKLIPLLIDHPIDDSECFSRRTTRPEMVCIHPQLAYHGFVDKAKLRDLSIELTLRPYQYSDSIEFVEQLRVDIMDLYRNEDNPTYSSLHSISGQRATLDGPWESTSAEEE